MKFVPDDHIESGTRKSLFTTQQNKKKHNNVDKQKNAIFQSYKQYSQRRPIRIRCPISHKLLQKYLFIDSISFN